ncbi:oxidoreductase, partial [bacterium]|nr:oxidoreductase [bacterium]
KCGVGKCGHCQINNTFVCTEGPVYNGLELKSLQEAL